ncbi:alpha/beta fold hydrolase [Streptomyces vinaceus]|uniref:alpha/beta fold hydrolase n=1 Tax=Streptomyces vinaceus TaxID=1960 RepID=UPI003801DCBE
MTSTIPTEPERAAALVAGRRLSFLDFGGPGRPLLALHGHFAEGRTFTRLARELGGSWRVIALDQRGHGYSDRPADFSRTGYVGDAAAVLDIWGSTARSHSATPSAASTPISSRARARTAGTWTAGGCTD